MDLKKLGKKIRNERTKRHMTQEKLAESIGISVSFLGHIERGSRKASVETLVSIANALQVGMDYLLGELLEYGELSQNNRQQRIAINDISRFIDENWTLWIDTGDKES